MKSQIRLLTAVYYEAARGTEHLRQLFGEFIGYIICDAYISYQVLEKENPLITVAGCLMHCRRYLAEALFVNDISSMSDEEINTLLETKALLLIREIYIAESFKNLFNETVRPRTPKKRKQKATNDLAALNDTA